MVALPFTSSFALLVIGRLFQVTIYNVVILNATVSKIPTIIHQQMSISDDHPDQTQIMALGAFCTADASLIVFLIGPEKSRPFTMAFHATIGSSQCFLSVIQKRFIIGVLCH